VRRWLVVSLGRGLGAVRSKNISVLSAANECADDNDVEDGSADANARRPPHVLRVDFSERNARLVDRARACGDFDVRMDRLEVGDYCIDGSVVIERKTYVDFAMSLADGRLFPQAAALARSPHRPMVVRPLLVASRDEGIEPGLLLQHIRRRPAWWPPSSA
jgi:hypothetical protein